MAAFAHIHFDEMMKFSPFDVAFVQHSMSLYLINQSGQLRFSNNEILRREVRSGGGRGTSALSHYLNTNSGMNGECLDGC